MLTASIHFYSAILLYYMKAIVIILILAQAISVQKFAEVIEWHVERHLYRTLHFSCDCLGTDVQGNSTSSEAVLTCKWKTFHYFSSEMKLWRSNGKQVLHHQFELTCSQQQFQQFQNPSNPNEIYHELFDLNTYNFQVDPIYSNYFSSSHLV